ncbi:PEP-CTERM sorting domain-containing protein [Thalassotalea sp. 1_MG-2023]|uniref:PEP-CTERM sorting domain-containing protein n=1 Tax=Thalassotalea sp. 1_MG-2023 TaxID=3062680 RepID=UPI0026E30102|nr:PEP-CTERM sorting domain-containing protein [Thalassotalea sp. 1_MG-2023]MDO6428263.1 PEP-CTERM sorting domain-containing protein [Thalassotalea sp. 1_MG-2023]
MTLTIIKSSLVSLLVLATSYAHGTLIDFDTDANGNVITANTAITNQYQNWGVTFAGFEDNASININAAPDPDGVTAPSGSNVLTNCAVASLGCPGNRADIVEILFSGSSSNISLMLDTLGSSSVTFELYDINNLLLETKTVSSNTSTYVPVSFSSVGVSKILGLQPNESWAWAMDDLSFDMNLSAEIPEPSIIFILSLGLLALRFSRVKK